MGEIVLVIIGAALVNNFVLVQFLGLCPLFGASRKIEGAIGMSLATGLVLTLASGLSFMIDRWLLEPLELAHLRLISFILVIGAAVQLTDTLIRWHSPLLHRVLGLYIPLIASNCAVLGVALLNATAHRSVDRSSQNAEHRPNPAYSPKNRTACPGRPRAELSFPRAAECRARLPAY